MESVGAAASIIQIVVLAIQTTTLAYETTSNILHAPESVIILQKQIEGLLQVLNNILELGQQCQHIRPSSAPADNALARLKLQVKSCQENVADILHRFKKLVETDEDRIIGKIGKRIRVISKDEDLKRWSNILSVHLGQLGVGVGVLESHLALWQAHQFERQGHSNLLQHSKTHDKLDRLASSISAGQIDVNRILDDFLNSLNAQSNIMSTVSANTDSQQANLIGRLDRIENSVQTGFDTQEKSGNSILRNIQDLAAKVDLGFSQNCDLVAKQGGQSQQLIGMMEQMISMMQNIQTTSNNDSQALQSVDPPQVPPEAQPMGLTNFESVWHELSRVRSSDRQTIDNISPEIMNCFDLFNKVLQSVKERLPQTSDYRSVISLKKKEMITDVEYWDWEELYASSRHIENAKRALRMASSMRHTTLNKRSAKGYPSRLWPRSTITMSTEFQGCSVAVETTKTTCETFTSHSLHQSQIRGLHGGTSGKETEEEIVTTFYDIRNSNDLASVLGYSELQISMLVTESMTRYGSLVSIPCLVMRNVRGWDETSRKVVHAAARGDTAVLSYLFASGKASPKDYYPELSVSVSNPKSLIGMAADIPTIKFLLQAGAELCEDLNLSHKLWKEIFAQTVNWEELFTVLEKYDFDCWRNLLNTWGTYIGFLISALVNRTGVGRRSLRFVVEGLDKCARQAIKHTDSILSYQEYIVDGLENMWELLDLNRCEKLGIFFAPPADDFIFIISTIAARNDDFNINLQDTLKYRKYDTWNQSWFEVFYILAQGLGILPLLKALYLEKGIPLPNYPLSLSAFLGGVQNIRDGRLVRRREIYYRGTKLFDLEYHDIEFLDENSHAGAYLRYEPYTSGAGSFIRVNGKEISFDS